MLHSTPTVDAAFTELLNRLTAETEEMKKVGSETFHGGAPREAQGLLGRAKVQLELRDHIARLHLEWKRGLLVVLPKPAAIPAASELRAERAQPGLIKNIEGMSLGEAAKKLGTTPAKMKAWLEAGTLKGYQRVGGTWKITQADLVAFMREHRNLL